MLNENGIREDSMSVEKVMHLALRLGRMVLQTSSSSSSGLERKTLTGSIDPVCRSICRLIMRTGKYDPPADMTIAVVPALYSTVGILSYLLDKPSV